MTVSLTPSELSATVVTERVVSVFSLLGILFILATFLIGRGFDKPINRLIFLASWSNVGSTIAFLISVDGVNAGPDSALCQFQAWDFQLFLGVDAYWALCMAINVYLALFRGWNAPRLQAQDWKYFVGCYGVALIPAITYLFLNSPSRGRVYGPALIWCWVTSKWDFLRMATFYCVIWVALLGAFVIYCAAFSKVWRLRKELGGLFNPLNEDPFSAIVTTEIEIVSTSRPEANYSEGASKPQVPVLDRRQQEYPDPYTIDIGAKDIEHQRPDVFRLGSLTRNAALSETNPDAWLYARVAFLYFCALLISWIPSSINRVYSIIRPDAVNWGLNYTETLVFPMQGFWNAVVYIITSQTACRNLWRSMRGKPELPRKNVFFGGLDSSTADMGVKRVNTGTGSISKDDK
ncbi:hypothetical protein P7C71_g6149, partial [Lecanoromycetidae sp. Uapishka_2]